jgi:hypothetical protein
MSMQDRPTALELLAAVRGFLEDDVVPALEGRRRFHALVAANVLSIVERELAGEEEALLAEWTALGRVLGEAGEPPPRLVALRAAVRGRKAALAARIRAGEADAGPWADAARGQVRTCVRETLRVANPRALGPE